MMMGQPGMMMQPGMAAPGMIMVQANPLNFMNGLDKLMSVPGVYIKQKLELLEVLTGCETENKYVVYPASETGEKLKHSMFKAKEKSNCLARVCLNGDCRPFKVKVVHDADGPSSTEGQEFMKFNREFACACCCFCRPEMAVTITEAGADKYIGKVRAPFKCCDLELEIYDSSDRIKYYINGSCCQLGIWCRWPCEPCQTVDFEILDSNRNQVAKLQKRTAGCLKSAISDADQFSLMFPQNASNEDRALLVAGVIMLDFRYFEQNPNQNNNGGI